VENKKKKKIHRDKNGREFIKESYFVGGKMKISRIYVIDRIPEQEFYEQNATDMDFYINGDYELISCNKGSDNLSNEKSINESDINDNDCLNDLPF